MHTISEFDLVMKNLESSSRNKYLTESFIEFINISEMTGKEIADIAIGTLSKNTLHVYDMRGQCYESGPNMKGEHIGVQAQNLSLNPLAMFISCSMFISLSEQNSGRLSELVIISYQENIKIEYNDIIDELAHLKAEEFRLMKPFYCLVYPDFPNITTLFFSRTRIDLVKLSMRH